MHLWPDIGAFFNFNDMSLLECYKRSKENENVNGANNVHENSKPSGNKIVSNAAVFLSMESLIWRATSSYTNRLLIGHTWYVLWSDFVGTKQIWHVYLYFTPISLTNTILVTVLNKSCVFVFSFRQAKWMITSQSMTSNFLRIPTKPSALVTRSWLTKSPSRSSFSVSTV